MSDKPYIVLTAKNRQVIGKSEVYESAAAMENGIGSVGATCHNVHKARGARPAPRECSSAL